MKEQTLKSRVTLKPDVCGGRPCIRDTRIEIAVILDGLAEGMTEADIIDHYPQLTVEDIRAQHWPTQRNCLMKVSGRLRCLHEAQAGREPVPSLEACFD